MQGSSKDPLPGDSARGAVWWIQLERVEVAGGLRCQHLLRDIFISPRSSPDVPPVLTLVGFGDRAGKEMKDLYTPKIGDEFHVEAVTVAFETPRSAETIQEFTKAIVLVSAVITSIVALFIAWIHGIATGNHVPLAIAVPTIVSILTFIFIWYSGKTESAGQNNTIQNQASSG